MVSGFKNILFYAIILFLQVLVLNHVHFAGYATPLIYIIIILDFARSSSRIKLLLTGFVLGLVMDMFTNTPGVASGATTLLAAIQPSLLSLFIPADSDESLVPSTREMGVGPYFRYAFLGILIHHAAFFLLESFSLFDAATLAINIFASVALTSVIIILVQSLRK